MKLENRFTVPVPAAQAWDVLLDVERIAPCMPGATLTSRDGDAFEGTVKVKVGPINLTYGGKAKFASLDEEARVAVIEGSGKETRGTGTAKATITCRLLDRGDTTDVEVDTDLAITGKPAQFGRGVLADVSAKLVDKFAACLSEEILSGSPEPEREPAAEPEPEAGPGPAAAAAGVLASVSATQPAAEPASASASAPAVAAPSTAPVPTRPAVPARREAEAFVLLDTAGMPVLRRAAPVVGGLLLLIAVLRRLRR